MHWIIRIFLTRERKCLADLKKICETGVAPNTVHRGFKNAPTLAWA